MATPFSKRRATKPRLTKVDKTPRLLEIIITQTVVVICFAVLSTWIRKLLPPD